jgi:type II secretory pathway component PulJ
MNHRSDIGSDRGSSLIETLVAAALVAVVSAALAASATSVSSTAQTILGTLENTRDIDRIRDRISGDLSTYPFLDTSPTVASHLPGTNVFALSNDESMSSGGELGLVSYRYVLNDDSPNGSHEGSPEQSWDLVRFHLEEPTTPLASATRNLIASHLTPPPEGWAPADVPMHAITVSTLPNASTDLGSVSEQRVIDVTFSSGARVTTGGMFRSISDRPSVPDSDDAPIVPGSRCGGTLTIVLNTSSTTWSQGAAPTVVGDLTGFIESMRGTPTHLRIVSFDRLALSFYPDVSVGTYVDLLNPSSAITTLMSKLSTLSTTSSSWRNGRNWEDGLWQAARLNTGTLLAQIPDTVVFITDGSPNRNRTNTTSDTDTTFHTADLTRAVTAANYARNTGAVLFGALLGTGATTTAISHLTSVFGSLTWDGSTSLAPIDRARSFTRPSTEGFARLDEILGLINRWRCGGTVTVQQRVLSNGVSSIPVDTWSIGVSTSDSMPFTTVSVGAGRTSATIDGGTNGDSTPQLITFTQQQRQGYRHHSASCTSDGTPISVDTSSTPDGTTIIRLTSSPEAVISCILTAEVLT